jgi:hypothetical protein
MKSLKLILWKKLFSIICIFFSSKLHEMENVKHLFGVNIKLVLQWLHDNYKDYICEKMPQLFLWNLFAWLKSTHTTTKNWELFAMVYLSKWKYWRKKHILLQFWAFEWLTFRSISIPKTLIEINGSKSWQIKHWNLIQESNILLVGMTTRYNEWYILLLLCKTLRYERQTQNNTN